MFDSHNNIITENNVLMNQREGIDIVNSNNLFISHNFVQNNTGSGMYNGYSKNNLIILNFLHTNPFGIYVSYCANISSLKIL